MTGTVITARYEGVPQVPISFSEEPGKGGTGMKVFYTPPFISMVFQGARRSSVTSMLMLSVRIYDETSLYWPIWDGTMWRTLDNNRVYSGANNVTGEAPVTKLVGAPVGLGGTPLVSSTENNSMALWVGLGGAALAAIVVLGIVLVRRRRNQ